MPRLLSGATLRNGGSGEFIKLREAMPQLLPSATTATGFTIATDELYRTTYKSSLGFVEFNSATLYSSLPLGRIKIAAAGSSFLSLNTTTGNLVVDGGIGVGGNMHIHKDIVVNGLTIGKGFEGINNIVITGPADAQLTVLNDGQESIVIGNDALTGISSSYKNIAIGRYALYTGTFISESIAIGDSALKNIGYSFSTPVANISNASLTDPVVITANDHNLTSGTYITINNVIGTTELNSQNFYIKILNNNEFELYSDIILSNSIDGTLYTTYISGGTVERILLKNNNIAIGNSSGENLIDGEKNFFIGDGVGGNITTGSNNFFIGHSVGNNITFGNNIIAIGGDNLVNGIDNQINIGSVFYYNGTGNLQLNTDAEVGLGSYATIIPDGPVVNTSTFTGGLIVIGGLVVTENSIFNKSIRILSTESSTSSFSGALVIDGGLGVKENLNVNQNLTVAGSGTVILTPENDVVIQPLLTGTVIISPTLTPGAIDNIDIGINVPRYAQFLEITATNFVAITSTTNSISTTTGALVVTGGVGIGGDVYIGGTIYGPSFETIGQQSNSVLVNEPSTATLYFGLTEFIGTYSSISSTSTLYYDNTQNTLNSNRITATGNLSNTVTNNDQALISNGGLYVENGIYNPVGGNQYENNLIHVPKIVISTTTPLAPLVGDFWIDPTLGVQLQYIQDGDQRLWVQFSSLQF